MTVKKAICVTALLFGLMAGHPETVPAAKRITESLQVLYTFERANNLIPSSTTQ
jgi:hypothetical protein